MKVLQFAQDYLATRTREGRKGTVDVTAPRQIEHVTLDTGHARRSARSAIEDEIIRVLDAGFDRAITTGAYSGMGTLFIQRDRRGGSLDRQTLARSHSGRHLRHRGGRGEQSEALAIAARRRRWEARD